MLLRNLSNMHNAKSSQQAHIHCVTTSQCDALSRQRSRRQV
jgi:hypothetical protein